MCVNRVGTVGIEGGEGAEIAGTLPRKLSVLSRWVARENFTAAIFVLSLQKPIS